MSPQNSTLGLIGGNFSSTSLRASQRSGIYRPEDNAYVRNYMSMVDNFEYTERNFTYSGINKPTFLSAIFIRPDNTQLFSCGGYVVDGTTSSSTDNSIYSNSFTEAGNISTLSNTSTYKPISWILNPGASAITLYPEPSGLSFSPDGANVILCGNLLSIPSGSSTLTDRGSFIFQYNLTTAWDITSIGGSSTWVLDSITYNVDTNPGSQFHNKAPLYGYSFATPTISKIQDIFVREDGLIFYYLRDNILYQGSISSAWNIGSNLNLNTGSLTIDPNLVSSSVNMGSFSGISFSKNGMKLYLTSKVYGGTIFQYNLTTAWDITTASFETFLYVGTYNTKNTLIVENGVHAIMLDDETIIHSTLENVTGRLYEYKIIPY